MRQPSMTLGMRAIWLCLVVGTCIAIVLPQSGWRRLRMIRNAIDRDAVRAMKVSELRQALGERGLPWANYIEKEELVVALCEAMASERDFCASGIIRPGAVAELTGEQLEVEIQDDSTPLIVDVYARWCGPCQLMAPELVKAARRLGTKARVSKVDSDLEPELSLRLRIGGLPTVILFNMGVEIKRIEGAVLADALVALVDEANPNTAAA